MKQELIAMREEMPNLYRLEIERIRASNREIYIRKMERIAEARAFNLAQRENLLNSFDDIAGIMDKIKAGEKVVLGSV